LQKPKNNAPEIVAFTTFTNLKAYMALRSLLYIIAVVLVLGWLLGFFYFKTAGNLIHILLVLALVSFVLGLFRKENIE